MKNKCFSAFLLSLIISATVLGCNDQGVGPGNETGAEAWGIVQDLKKVRAVDVTNDEIVTELDLAEEPSDIAYDQGFLWITAENDVVYKISTKDLKITAPFNVKGGAQMIRAGHGSVWLAVDGNAESKCSVIRINPNDGSVMGTYAVGENIDTISDFAVTDDGGVIVVVGNTFAVAKVSPSGVVSALPIGEGGGYGYGSIAVHGDKAFVSDRYKGRLLTLSVSPFKVQSTAPLSMKPAQSIATDGDYLFWGTPNSPNQIQIIQPLGTSIKTIASEALDAMVRSIALGSDGRIFVSQGDGAFGALIEIDAQTAKTLNTAHGAYLDKVVAP